MGWEAWLTLSVVITAVVTLVRDWLPPAATMLTATVGLLAAGIITPTEAFSGFSNPAPITIAALYVLAKAVEKTGALTPLVAAILGESDRGRSSLARLVAPTAAASAFLNNTPIVAMLAPQVGAWAERRGRSPSLYLMPLSFAAILGGVVTLMGTATNLVVSGLLEASGYEPIGFFEIAGLGLPVAAAGLTLLVLLSPRLLPARLSAHREIADHVRDFVVDMVVRPGGTLEGKTVEEAGLRNLSGVFLVEIARHGDVIAPVSPRTVLRGDDGLRFVGKVDQVVDLQTLPGLASAEQSHVVELDTRRRAYFEAVVGAASPLVGKTLKEARFRGRYQAAVMALHRAGRRIDAKLGEVRLHVGDTLLLLADPSFRERWSDRRDFLLVSRLGEANIPTSKQANLVGLAGLGIVALAATGTLPLVTAALLGAAALVLLQLVTPGEARDAVNLDVIVTIAAAFGLAQAIERSGLAERLAGGLVDAFDWWGDRGVLLGAVAATIVLTELITNNAAALLMFPIALSSATVLGADPRGFAIAMAVAASASFLTPIGYQTNTMVYGPGGYRFGDYARLGGPLTLAVSVITVVLTPLVWPA